MDGYLNYRQFYKSYSINIINKMIFKHSLGNKFVSSTFIVKHLCSDKLLFNISCVKEGFLYVNAAGLWSNEPIDI